MFRFKPLQCSFSTMNLHPSFKSLAVWNRLFSWSFHLAQFSSPCQWKASLRHDAATSMLRCRNGALRVMGNPGVVPHIAFHTMAKTFPFPLVWPENFLLLGFVEPVSCCLGNSKCVFLFYFLKQWSILWPLIHETLLYGVILYHRQILPSLRWISAAPRVFSLFNLMSLRSVRFSAQLSLVRSVLMSYSFLFMITDLMVLCGTFWLIWLKTEKFGTASSSPDFTKWCKIIKAAWSVASTVNKWTLFLLYIQVLALDESAYRNVCLLNLWHWLLTTTDYCLFWWVRYVSVTSYT